MKLHVGVVPTYRNGFDYMSELHGSSHMQAMIAEINAPFQPDLIVIDGVEAFVDGGPATGKRVEANVFLSSTDRVAIDAVGVAILKKIGSTPAIMQTDIFAHEQIARAVELDLGAPSPSMIELASVNAGSRALASQVAAVLEKG